MLPVIRLPNKIVRSAMLYDVQIGRSRQSKPYNVPTDYYRRRIVYSVKHLPERDASTDIHIENVSSFSVARDHAHNKAYERLIAKLKDPSSFGATATAERRETFGMITTILVNMAKAANHARKGDVISLLRTLSMHPPTKVVKRSYPRKRGSKRRKYVKLVYLQMPSGRWYAKKSANAWLFWSYGVSPLMDDVQKATETFIRAVPAAETYSGAKTEKSEYHYLYNQYGTLIRDDWSGSVAVRIVTKAACHNADLWLLNQLGLLNPVQWLNEAVPFSFVIDWCSNWSSVINSLTDLAGISLTDTATTTTYRGDQAYQRYGKDYVDMVLRDRYQRKVLYMTRNLGLQTPKLVFRYERFEWQRGLNAISLLVGFLPKTQK